MADGMQVCSNDTTEEVYTTSLALSVPVFDVHATWKDSLYPPSTLRSAVISKG